MNKPLTLIAILAGSLPFVGCESNQVPGRDTIFHQTDENPRTGMTQRSRYGHQGTHSPNDQGRTSYINQPSDPDGIVKPRDLDPVDPNNPDPNTVGDPIADDPALTGGGTTDPAPATTSGEPPYAEAVPGKYGLVYSPFVKNKKEGLVNVTDENNVPLPPGTEVTDPHTGKIFRVP